MLDKEQILTVLRAPHKFMLRHTNGHSYRLDKPVKFKADGSWRDGVLYRRDGESTIYGRELGDFSNFTLHENSPRDMRLSGLGLLDKPIRTGRQTNKRAWALAVAGQIPIYSVAYFGPRLDEGSILNSILAGSYAHVVISTVLITLISMAISLYGIHCLVIKDSWTFKKYHKALCRVSKYDLIEHKQYLEKLKSIRGDIAMSSKEICSFARSVDKRVRAIEREKMLGFILG